MLIDCPKCGFQQPKDQYCANCGVDIPKYLKRQKKSFSALLKNSTFQSTVIVGITLIVAYSYFKYQNANKAKHIKENTAFMSRSLKQRNSQLEKNNSASEHLENASIAHNATSTNDELSPPTEQRVRIDASDKQREAIAPSQPANSRSFFNRAGTQKTANTNSAKPDSSNENSAAASSESKQPATLQMTVQIFEVPSVNINYWEQNNTRGDVRTVPTNELAKLKNLRALSFRTFKLAPQTSQKISFEARATENANDLGLGLDLVLQRAEGQIGQAHIRKRFHIKSEDSPTFGFTTAQGQASYIFWPEILLGFEHYPDLLNIPPFTILNSGHFKNNNSELIIVISVDK